MQVEKCQDSFRKLCVLEYDKVPRRAKIKICRDEVARTCAGSNVSESGELLCTVESETGVVVLTEIIYAIY